MIEQAQPRDVFGGMSPEERRRLRSPEGERYRQLIAERQIPRRVGEVNPVKAELPGPAELNQHIQEVALKLGASLVGITYVNQDYAYQGKTIPERFAISLAMEMDREALLSAPSPQADTEYSRVYYELGEATVRLGEYIRSLGYPAYVHHPLGAGRLLQVPFAIASGLARLGRIGVALSPQYGPRIRLGCITTDLPLAVTQLPNGYRAEFCDRCLACWRACPPQAIARELSGERGIERYVLDWEKCRGYSNYHHGCGLCLKVCPYKRVRQKAGADKEGS